MYKSFTAKNYRCFADLTIEPLERINLIVGKNNVGKTALLEALWLYHGYHTLGVSVSAYRGFERQRANELLWDLFSDFDPTRTIELVCQDSDDRLKSLHITMQERLASRGPSHNRVQERASGYEFPTAKVVGQKATTEPVKSKVLFTYHDSSGEPIQTCVYVGPDGTMRFEQPATVEKPKGVFLVARRPDNPQDLVELFSDLAIGKKEKVIQTLQIIESRLKNLAIQHRGGVPTIYGDVGLDRLVPLPLMGDGIGRLLGIALAISTAPGGIVLIDEVESGLHYTVMSQVWQAIARLAREYDVQIFATTHSEECIRAAHQAFAADEVYDFALHRLEWVKGVTRAVTYDQGMLDAAIEIDVEVR